MPAERRTRRGGFIAGTLAGLADALDHDHSSGIHARKAGLLQSLDPRVKLAGALVLIVATVHAREIALILAFFALAVALAGLSNISLRLLATRVWVAALWFTGLIALPAIFLTPGEALWRLPVLAWPVTGQGLTAAARLILRAETTATMGLLLVLSTPWTHLMKALRIMRVPAILVLILGMTYRYIFLLLHLARDLFEARESRTVAPVPGFAARRLAASGAAVLLDRSILLSGDVFRAMQSRGFRGEAYSLDEFRMRGRDWAAIAAAGCVAAAAFLVERG